MTDKPALLKRMTDCGVVAVFRCDSAQKAVDLAQAAVDGGIVSVEITLTTPDAIWGIEQLCAKVGDRAIVGAGTVMDARGCKDAITAGAQFIVSPAYDAQTFIVASRSKVITIPGAFTPAEILAVTRAGADIVKVFPSTSVGPTYFRDVLRPLPWLKLMPTGGVTLGNAAEWIKAGAVMLGIGGDLTPADAVARGDFKAIAARAGEFVKLVQDARAAR